MSRSYCASSCAKWNANTSLHLVECNDIARLNKILVVLDLLTEIVNSYKIVDNCALHLQLLDSVSDISKLVLLPPEKSLHLDSLDEFDELVEVDDSAGIKVILVTVSARRFDVKDNRRLADWCCLLLLCLRTEKYKKKLHTKQNERHAERQRQTG